MLLSMENICDWAGHNFEQTNYVAAEIFLRIIHVTRCNMDTALLRSTHDTLPHLHTRLLYRTHTLKFICNNQIFFRIFLDKYALYILPTILW